MLAEGLMGGETHGTVTSLVKDKLSSEGTREGGEGRLLTLDAPIDVETLVRRAKEHLKLSQSEPSL